MDILKNILIVSIILLHLSGYSQHQITIGEPYTYQESDLNKNFYQDSKVLSIKATRNGSVSLQQFDANNLALLNQTLYTDFPDNTRIENVLKFSNRYLVFFSIKTHQHENLYVREIDFQSGTFLEKITLVLALEKYLPEPTFFTTLEPSSKKEFYFMQSEDASQLAIQTRLYHRKKERKNHDEIELHVLGTDLNEIWRTKIKLPHPRKKMNYLDCILDSNGNVRIATRTQKDHTRPSNFQLEIFTIPAFSNTVQSTVFNIGRKFPHSMQLLENPSGQILCTGFFEQITGRSPNHRSQFNTNGILHCKMNRDGSNTLVRSYEIPAYILAQHVSPKEVLKVAREEKKGKAEFKHLMLEQVVMHTDESFLVVGEQRYLVAKSQPPKAVKGSHNNSTSLHFYNTGIFLAKVNSSDSLLWMEKLPKIQIRKSWQRETGFAYISYDTIHKFFVMDRKENMELKNTEIPKPYRAGTGGYLTEFTVDDRTGQVIKNFLLDTRNSKGKEILQFLPYQMISIAPGTFVFEVRKNKKNGILVKVVQEIPLQ